MQKNYEPVIEGNILTAVYPSGNINLSFWKLPVSLTIFPEQACKKVMSGSVNHIEEVQI